MISANTTEHLPERNRLIVILYALRLLPFEQDQTCSRPTFISYQLGHATGVRLCRVFARGRRWKIRIGDVSCRSHIGRLEMLRDCRCSDGQGI